MNETKHDHDIHTEGHVAHMQHRPYWRRAHRDWRVWVAVLVIFAAMTIYVMSDNLSWWPRGVTGSTPGNVPASHESVP